MCGRQCQADLRYMVCKRVSVGRYTAELTHPGPALLFPSASYHPDHPAVPGLAGLLRNHRPARGHLSERLLRELREGDEADAKLHLCTTVACPVACRGGKGASLSRQLHRHTAIACPGSCLWEQIQDRLRPSCTLLWASSSPCRGMSRSWSTLSLSPASGTIA